MKIQTSEAVRRFNAQVELVDIALDYAAHEISDPGALDRLLQLAGHRQLGEIFKESMRQVMITGSGWPAAKPQEPGQPPDKAAASNPTKSAGGSQWTPQGDYAPDLPQPAAKLARAIVEKVERYISERDTAWSDIGLIVLVEEVIRKDQNWREFIKNCSRPGDIANVILQRDEMRTTLKQSRSSILKLVKVLGIFNGADAWFREIEPQLTATMERISSIIPPSEI